MNNPIPSATAKIDSSPRSNPSKWTWPAATQPTAPAATNTTPSHLRSRYGLRNRSSRKDNTKAMTSWIISDMCVSNHVLMINVERVAVWDCCAAQQG